MHLRFVGASYSAPKGHDAEIARPSGDWGDIPLLASRETESSRKERVSMAFEFAQFVALRDEPLRLPDPRRFEDWPAYEEVATKIENIDLPNLNADRTAVLAFKVTPHYGGRLRMRFNDRAGPSVDRIFTQLRADGEQVNGPPIARSWHEIVAGRLLKPDNNSLVISITPMADIPPFSSGPFIVISDIVIFYHAIVDQVS
jgi:hypothetical protein